MLTQNSGDVHKARSNHWFFAYLPDSVSLHRNRRDAGSIITITSSPLVNRLLPYSFYAAFVSAAILALYTQIVIVHPLHDLWEQATTEAYGLQHIMAKNEHERLARKFHIMAHEDIVQGVRDRVKAAHEINDSYMDRTNASLLIKKEKQESTLIREEKQDALGHAHDAATEHELYLQYMDNASTHEARAEELEEEAHALTNHSLKYQRLAKKFESAVLRDQQSEVGYFLNATRERDAAYNITKAEETKEDDMWVCRWQWSRKYVCGALGGVTALGEAESLHQQEAKDYRAAVQLERQVLVERTFVMIAMTKAQQAEQEAKLDNLRAEQSRNETIQDQLKAEEEHGLELKDLRKELEDMHREETHVKELAYYKELQGKLSKQSKKEGQDAHRDWEKGTELIKESEESQEKSNAEYEMAKRESEIQEQTLQLVRDLGRRLRFFSFLTIISALVSLVCFVVALVTTTTVSLGYHIQGMFAAASATVLNLCENHGVSWEGRSILGDNRKCFFVRQLSCWVHHILFFLVAVAVQGSQLNGLFAYDSWRVRGDVLLRFAITASILETVVFQAIPNISILPCLTLEYVRNVAIRLLSSTLQFAIQMLLLMILCGQNCSWLFDLIQFVSRTCLVWIMLMIVTVVFHFWYIEYPYALALCRRNGPLSDMTSITCGGVTLESDSLFGGNNMIASRLLDEEKGSLGSVGSTQEPSLPSHQCLETESLLTASHAEVPNTSLGSGPYSSISLGSATVSHTLQSEAVTFPPAAVSRLYEVSIQDEWFVILAHVELVLLTGVLLVVCAALPNLAAHH